MKRKTAKEILAESFRELSALKSADKITIKDIASNCGYSTATFYRNFKDKYDLIAWDYARKYMSVLLVSCQSGGDCKNIFFEAAMYFDSQK